MKANKYFFFSLISFFLIVQSLTGQDIWYNVVSNPPSPNASSLGKYGEYPVDKSTGVPSISIPIYEINYGGMKVPISLSYHASGIKVNDEESSAGMGWSLNAGGVITRVMKGRPDELQYGYLSRADSVPSEEYFNARINLPICTVKDSLDYIAKNQWDYEPDIFYYNFLNFSGSFFIDPDTICRLRPDSKEKFKFIIIEASYSFRVTDTEGIIYFFEEAELTESDIRGDLPEYISTWYLSSILNPRTGKTIRFTYDADSGFNRTWNLSQSKMYRMLPSSWYEFVDSTNQYTSTISFIRNEKRLSRIDFGDAYIYLNSSEAYGNHLKLDEITVHSDIEQIKRFLLDYDIITSVNSQRLRLLSFSEIGDTILNKYTFEYDNQTLPDRNTYQLDHWGYFNGQNNTELIPQLTFNNQTIGTADREPHWPYTQAGILKKITYPTGGYTEFEYESNEYAGEYPYTLKSFPLNVTGNYYAQNCISQELDWISEDSTYIDAKIITTVTTESQPFTYEFNPFKSMGLKRGGPWIEKQNNLPEHYGRFDFRSSGLILSRSSSLSQNSNQLENNELENIYYDSLIVEPGPSFEGPVDSLPGSQVYTFSACASDHLTTTNSVFSYKVRQKNPGPYPYVTGGIRIKTIKSYDPDTDQSNYKEYDYNLSGYMTNGLPTYNREAKLYYNTQWNGVVIIEPRMFLYSHPVDGLGASSNTVAYQKVTEFFGTTENNIGKVETDYYFSNDEGTGGYFYTPSISNQWLRSKVTSETTFKKTDTGYDTVLQKSYIYTSTPYSFLFGFKATRTSEVDYQGWMQCRVFDDYVYNNFQIRTTNSLTSQETVKQYFPENRIVQTINNYYYDIINWNHFFPLKTESYNSNDDLVSTRYVYPTDTTGNSVFTYMKNYNILSSPITKSVSVNDNKIQENRWNYNVNSSTNKLFLESAEELVSKTPSNSYRPVMIYQQYDSIGNPTQVLGKDGVTISYIWGYNKEYPAAKIENATLSEITTILGGSIPNLGLDGLSDDQSNQLRTGLPDAMVTIYTYKPLVGILSQTDPNGIKTSFEYDNFNRLKLVKDADGRILKTYEYHYK